MALLMARGSSRMLAVMAIVTTAALWGASMPLVKQLIDTFPPCTLAAIRLAIAVLVLVPVLMIQGRRPHIGPVSIALGVTGVALSHLLQNFGMEQMPAGPAAVVLLAGTVVLTSALGWLVLGERCSLPVVLAMIGCGLGVALVAFAGSGSAMAFPLMGLLLVVGAAFTWSLYAVIGRRPVDADPMEVTAGALLVGLVLLLPFVAYERPNVGTMAVGTSDAIAMLVLGSVVTAGSYLCWSFGIRHLKANEASVLCAVEPAFGLIFAWILLREGIALQEAIGAAVIVASCILVARGEQTVAEVAPVAVEPEPQGVSMLVAL